MRTLLSLCFVLTTAAHAGIVIDAAFWDHYQPNQQYSATMLRDLIALNEGDLIDTSRGSDGLVLRMVGRSSASSELISARIAIDSIARGRLQVKVLPLALPRAEAPQPESYRRPVTGAQARTLVALLDEEQFWDAPYRLGQPAAGGDDDSQCPDTSGWLIEGLKPGLYQIIYRSNCRGLDPATIAIRDLLLGLAGVSAK